MSRVQVGNIFETNKCGAAKVIHYWNHSQIMIRFIKTGTVLTVTATALRNGEIKDPMAPNILGVGFTGIGDHKISLNKKLTKEYSTWYKMLTRCYDPKWHEKQPTYIGCTVCERWHNFQNFCEDIKTLEGYEMWKVTPFAALDKDIRVPGNKIYSPETCMFVTKSQNSAEAMARKNNKR